MNILKRGFILIALSGLPFIFSSCLDTGDFVDSNEQLTADIKAIDSYLLANSIVALKDPYGLRMTIEKLGTGLPAIYGNTVKVKYKGTLFTTGATFDQSESYSVVPNTTTGDWDVISGWKIALLSLPEGSKAKVYIPSGYAYGTQANGSIPVNSILVFEMEILQVVRPAAYYTKIASDSVAIDAFLADHSITNAVKDSTGIRYVINTVGTGPTATWFNRLTITKYKATLLDGTLVYESPKTISPDDTFFSRPVDYTVNGVKIGLQKMNEGSKYTFYVPSGYAYGTKGLSPTIPANANMIFEIEVQTIAAP